MVFGHDTAHVNAGRSERNIFYSGTASSILGTYSAFCIQDLPRSLCQRPFIKLNVSGYAASLGPTDDISFLYTH